MKTFKALGALIDYPEQDLIGALDEVSAVLDAEALVRKGNRRELDHLMAELRARDPLDMQAHYVGLFDRVRSLSLHLFEHVHGESRERGQAMVSLRALYSSNGFVLTTNELPDFLPVFLEYLSSRPLDEAREQLAETSDILEAMWARLAKRRSPYASVFGALLVIAGVKPATPQVSDEEIRSEDDPATLDRLWQEEPAFGGAPKNDQDVAVVQFHPCRT